MKSISLQHLTLKEYFKIHEFYSELTEEDKKYFHPSLFYTGKKLKWISSQLLLILSSIYFTRKLLSSLPLSIFLIFSIAKYENKVIGVCYLIVFKKLEKIKGSYAIAVHPNWRGKGLGKKLSDYILKFAKNYKINEIELIVPKENIKAILLYEKLGFKIVKKLPKKDKWNGKFIPSYLMVLKN